jgi:hypothetical protein
MLQGTQVVCENVEEDRLSNLGRVDEEFQVERQAVGKELGGFATDGYKEENDV